MADALIEKRGHVLIVTMNRPESRNALSGEMLSIMVEAWDQVDNDPDIRVCILTGAGGYFCAGMDLKAATAKPPGDSFKDGSYDPSRIDGLLKGRRLTKPLIAAVEGPAIAGGTEILQGTDIRVAGESAKFGISEAKWSLYPMGGSAVRLVRQIPYTIACELLLTGRHITAAEALQFGLIGREPHRTNEKLFLLGRRELTRQHRACDICHELRVVTEDSHEAAFRSSCDNGEFQNQKKNN